MEPVKVGVVDSKILPDTSEVERVTSPDDTKEDLQNYSHVDAEVAKYSNAARIEISEAESKRLKKMIDRRVSADASRLRR